MNENLSTTLKILGITILIVIVSSSLLIDSSADSCTHDIRIHDIYRIVNSIAQLVFLILLALFSIALVASIGTGFKNKLYVRMLLFSIFLLISFGMYIFFLLII